MAQQSDWKNPEPTHLGQAEKIALDDLAAWAMGGVILVRNFVDSDITTSDDSDYGYSDSDPANTNWQGSHRKLREDTAIMIHADAGLLASGSAGEYVELRILIDDTSEYLVDRMNLNFASGYWEHMGGTTVIWPISAGLHTYKLRVVTSSSNGIQFFDGDMASFSIQEVHKGFTV